MNTMMRPMPASFLRPATVVMCPRRITVRAASDSAESTTAPPSHLVATLLVQREEELKQMIAPGQLAPRAAVIAAKRKEIAALRAQLKSAVAANLPPTLASDLPIPPSAPVTTPIPSPAAAAAALAAASTSAPALGKPKPSTSRAPAGLGARDALLMIEHQLSVASGSGSADEDILVARGRNALYAVEQSLSLGVNRAAAMDEMAELESLQQEHMLLKARLEALQERQRQLEIIKQRVQSGEVATQIQKAAVEKETEKESSEAPKRRTRRTTKASKSDSESDSESPKPKVKRSYKKKEAGAETVPRQRAAKKAEQVVAPSILVQKTALEASAST